MGEERGNLGGDVEHSCALAPRDPLASGERALPKRILLGSDARNARAPVGFRDQVPWEQQEYLGLPRDRLRRQRLAERVERQRAHAGGAVALGRNRAKKEIQLVRGSGRCEEKIQRRAPPESGEDPVRLQEIHGAAAPVSAIVAPETRKLALSRTHSICAAASLMVGRTPLGMRSV